MPQPFDIDISAERPAIPEAPRVALRPGPARRFVAFAADAVVLALIAGGFAAGALSFEPYPFDAMRAEWRVFLALVALLGVAYSWFFAMLGAPTPGLALSGLRLRKLNGTPLTPQQAFVRALLTLPSAGLALFGFTLALFDTRGQTLHDKLCRCVTGADAEGSAPAPLRHQE